ncbi:Ig-like domain-containing protein [Plastoroseomonas hellenica]|uniref:Ig-like domain-containing protein n=1 Tax=Plastoroseomonas hellenica TaxID=2687306 RepID=UPI001BA4DDE7|nr:Ig-like domain-containing protein [Plastoroseomonas hellenica]MBR0646952.1 tandem-95 repeat protein [Plastoroseomonas hellenica]
MTAPIIGGLHPITYGEGAAPVNVGTGATFTGGLGYPGGSITFDLSSPDGNDVLALTSAADGIASGAISVDPDGSVYLGNGASRDLIGAVDAIQNGQNGQPLTINFTANDTSLLSNPGFENGFTGWTIVEDRVILGTTVVNGQVSPDDLTDPANSGDDAGAVDEMTYDSEVSTAEHSEGTSSLRLFNSGTTSAGFDVVHGPTAYSETFASQAGDILKFDWKAAAGGDAYDAFGYLMNADTGQAITVLDETGADDTGVKDWTTASVVVPSTGNWYFVFVAGTYDFTGLMGVGGSLYIDNFSVTRSSVTDSVLQSIANQVTYQNTGDAPLEDRTLTIGVTDGTGSQQNADTDLDVTNVDDAPTGGVTVTGTAEQGAVLTASNNIADPDGPDPLTIAYQWQRQDADGNWVNIGGATAATYTLTQDDVGQEVRAVASYTDAGGTPTSLNSNETAAVANVDDDPTGAVSVAGDPTQGEVLTASNTIDDLDGVDPASITYKWQRQDGDGNWVDIAGATDPTYTLTQDDVGHPVRAVAQYTDGQGTAEELASTPTTPVGNVDDAPAGDVTVVGDAEQGAVLTAANDLTDPDGPNPLTISYQWQRQDDQGNWVNISGATGTTYTLTQDDVGHAVRTVASYTDAGGQSESFNSNETAAVGNVDDDPTGAVSVAGDPTQGEVLTASNTIDDLDGVDPADIAYKWQRQDADGNWADITGATGATYTLSQDDVGHAVRAVAHYTDDLGAAEELPSLPTTAVANVNDTPVAGDDSFNVAEDTATVLDVLANDVDIDGDTRQITHVNGVAITAGIPVALAGGTVTLNDEGKLLFTPDAEFNGPVSFDYTIDDGNGETSIGTVDLNVTAANDVPVSANDSFTAVADGSSVTLDVLANDVDADGDLPRITQIDGRAIAPGGSLEVVGGLVTLNADGDLVFTASMTFDGTAQFTYTVDDGHGGTATGTVTGDVTATGTWGEVGDQLDALLGEQGITQPNYVNNLLYIASVVSPGAFNLADGSNGTGAGYHMGLGYDLTPSAATPDLAALSRSLAALIEAQQGSNAPGLLAGDDGSGWSSAVDQSLLFQSKLATSTAVDIDYTGGGAAFSDLASQGWSRQFAQMALRADFSEDMVIQADARAQGQLHQVTVGQGAALSVNIGGQAAGAPQAVLSNGFGMADFVTADGNSAVEVARAVAVAATVDGSDDQTAIVRMRQGGTLDLRLQFYEVDDFTGAIGGLRPGDAGYAAAASARAYQTGNGSTWLSGGGFGKYSEGAVVGIDHDDLIAMRLSNGTQEFFAFAQANETVNGQAVGHLWSYGLNTWGWEDLAGGGDRDFNDLIVQLDFTSAHTDQVL